MRTYYRISEDLFIAVAAISIGIAGGCKLFRIEEFLDGLITMRTLVKVSEISLLFSIALSLLELSGKKS